MKEKDRDKKLLYQKLFWLFMIGNLLGVILEGFWVLAKHGHWETHVVTIWGPFCLIYGIGCAGFYLAYQKLKNKNVFIQFITIAIVADIVEYFCGWLLEYGLHMRAWNYSHQFMNLNGHISLQMTIIWGIVGVIFIKFIAPFWDKVFYKMQGKMWNIAYICLGIFMIVNMSVTAVCLIRWKNRHEGLEPANKVSQLIDRTYNDKRMEDRFIEWYFINE